MKKIKFLILFIFLLKTTENSAQIVIPMPQVDVIVYSEKHKHRFYKRIGPDKFREIDLYIEEGDKLSYELDSLDEIASIADIKGKDENLLYVKDLRKSNVQEFSTYDCLLENKAAPEEPKFLLRIFSSSLAAVQELYFDTENSGGFGGSIKSKDDNLEKWRVADAYWYHCIFLDFGEGRHIVLFSDYNGFIECMLMPLENYSYVVSSEVGVLKVENSLEDAYKINHLESFNFFDEDYFYRLQKTPKNKYELFSIFGEKLLNAAYDTIVFNPFLIIAQRDSGFDIYNTRLQKADISSIEAAYLKPNGLEILSRNGAYYYDFELNIVDKLPQMLYTVCGTVHSTSYQLASENGHILKISSGGFASKYDRVVELFFPKLKQKHKLSFLNGYDRYYWSANDDYVGRKDGLPHLLKLRKGKKSGIIKYDYSFNDFSILDTTNGSWQNEIHYLREFPEAEVLLPVAYDSVTFNSSNGIVLFYKNDKVGIFPHHKKVQYKDFKQQTTSFYSFSKKRRKGWLDIKTFREYYFEE